MKINRLPFMNKKPDIWLIGTVLAVASVLAVLLPLAFMRTSLPGLASDNSATGTNPQSFSVGTNALLVLKEQSGNVSVYPGHSDAITITPRNHGTLVAPDPRSVRILYTHTHTAQGNDQITVTTDPWFSNTDFSLTVPSTTAMQIILNAGSIDVHTGHGLTASTTSGSIALDNLQGPVSVHTDSGDVTGNNITGPLTISASSGSIHLQKITGQVNAQTWSGDVIVNASAFNGYSSLQTRSGSVRFDGSLDGRGSYTMQTTNGDVDLTLPPGTAFSLDASTSSGTVQNAFGALMVGKEPQAHLSLHTQNGSVVIVKAA